MRNDERLRTIYEVMAPYIVRNEHNWRDYLAFASQFHKHSFDNILLVYAQDEDVSILATRKQWATIGRNLIPRAKGVAVCVYRNAKLTLDYLFDVSQTTGKEIHPTDWQLSDEMKKTLTERLSYAHGFSCPWDSGQVGWIYADKAMIEQEHGKITPEILEKVRQTLEAEVKEYDYYLTNQCYGFQLFKEDVEVDSCWGFLGEIRDVQDAVKEYLPEDCNPAIVESLQFQYEEPDIDEYLERLQEETEGLDCEPG